MKSAPFGVALMMVLSAGAAPGAVDDPNFVETDFLGPSDSYTSMAWAPDGSQRLFLTLKEGEVRIVENGVLLSTPFATLDPVFTDSECGLLGVAFDPNFGENQFVYFFKTVSASEQAIIRYRVDGNLGVEPTPIVEGLPTLGRNHDGGALAFGPDGKLYWAIGDLGPGVGAGADLESLAAKVGRVNRDGSVPDDNPFVDALGPNDDRIWARGFRNPFTMTFRPETGDLWLNVVGAAWEQVFVVGRGDHGAWGVAETLAPEGYIQSAITYRTNGVDSYQVPAEGAVRAGGVLTVTLDTPQRLRHGERIALSGFADPSFDGFGYVNLITSPESFTLAQDGPDATSGGGVVTTPDLGGCIVGGAFYDSTAATAPYRGNFFFADHNSGLIMRARLEGQNVVSVDPWASGHLDASDVALGPDGDLYHTAYRGFRGVVRETFLATEQRLVVVPTHPWMLEGGVAVVNVRLAMQPSASVGVTVRSASGVSVTAGGTLTFGANDWSVPKVVRLSAARDADANDQIIDLSVASAGLPSERVRVRVIDEYVDRTPPDVGGAGGAAGEETAGAAGRDATGGTGPDGGAGAQSGGGGVGEPGGEAGEGGLGGAGDDSRPRASSGGCGCATRRGGDGILVLVALLVVAAMRRRKRLARTHLQT